MDQFTAMKVFRRVIELEGFSAAARDLGLSNAAVSKNVSELEADLGVRLLTRTTRRLSVTEAGEAYYRRCVRVLEELDEARDEVADLAHTPRGTLRVSAPVSFALMHLAPAIPRFLELHPGLKLDLVLNDRVVDLVEEGFDLALRGGGELSDSSLVARKLAPIRRVVCGAPTYFQRRTIPKSPRDLADHECLVYSLASSPRQWSFRHEGSELSVRVDGRYQVSNSIALKQALLSGLGLSLIPIFIVGPELRRGELRAVLTRFHPAPQSLYAVHPHRRYVPQKTRSFIDFLSATFGGKPYWDRRQRVTDSCTRG